MFYRGPFIIIGIIAAGMALFLLLVRERTLTAIPSALPSTAIAPEKIPLPEPSQTPADHSRALPLAKPVPTPDVTAIKLFSAQAVNGVDASYDFSLYIPAAWRAETVQANASLNLYDPGVPGTTTLEQSQIFVRHFRAETFLTLSSVNVLSRVETTIAGRAAVDYVIEKKTGFANFRSQPLWRSAKHRVVDVRVTDAPSGPGLYYVFAKHPDLPDAMFEAVLETLIAAPKGLVFYPSDYFADGITKKPFGLYVSPTSSPVSPERFTGYHNAVDIEIPMDMSPTATIPIYAIADGVVAHSGRAQGYGGVVAIRHIIGGIPYLAIYGHLNPAILPRLGASIKAGSTIGSLGRGFTKETDGERRHLHFGLYTGSDVNIAGYVQSPQDLSKWVDPEKFFTEHISN